MSNRKRIMVVAAALAGAGVGYVLATGGGSEETAPPPVAVSGGSGGGQVTEASAEAPTVTVVKSPTCLCCAGWVEHLRDEGFRVEARDVDDVTTAKEELGVPRELWSCHTATVGGYVVEGHVPAGDIRRMLAEKPAVTGLAVPGMPVGPPGMEGPDPEAYDVIAFGGESGTSVFASHRP